MGDIESKSHIVKSGPQGQNVVADNLSVRLPPSGVSIAPDELNKALNGKSLVQYKLGTEQTLTLSKNDDGTFHTCLKNGSLSTSSTLSSEGKLISDKSYSTNEGERVGYQGIKGTASEISKIVSGDSTPDVLVSVNSPKK